MNTAGFVISANATPGVAPRATRKPQRARQQNPNIAVQLESNITLVSNCLRQLATAKASRLSMISDELSGHLNRISVLLDTIDSTQSTPINDECDIPETIDKIMPPKALPRPDFERHATEEKTVMSVIRPDVKVLYTAVMNRMKLYMPVINRMKNRRTLLDNGVISHKIDDILRQLDQQKDMRWQPEPPTHTEIIESGLLTCPIPISTESQTPLTDFCEHVQDIITSTKRRGASMKQLLFNPVVKVPVVSTGYLAAVEAVATQPTGFNRHLDKPRARQYYETLPDRLRNKIKTFGVAYTDLSVNSIALLQQHTYVGQLFETHVAKLYDAPEPERQPTAIAQELDDTQQTITCGSDFLSFDYLGLFSRLWAACQSPDIIAVPKPSTQVSRIITQLDALHTRHAMSTVRVDELKSRVVSVVDRLIRQHNSDQLEARRLKHAGLLSKATNYLFKSQAVPDLRTEPEFLNQLTAILPYITPQTVHQFAALDYGQQAVLIMTAFDLLNVHADQAHSTYYLEPLLALVQQSSSIINNPSFSDEDKRKLAYKLITVLQNFKGGQL